MRLLYIKPSSAELIAVYCLCPIPALSRKALKQRRIMTKTHATGLYERAVTDCRHIPSFNRMPPSDQIHVVCAIKLDRDTHGDCLYWKMGICENEPDRGTIASWIGEPHDPVSGWHARKNGGRFRRDDQRDASPSRGEKAVYNRHLTFCLFEPSRHLSSRLPESATTHSSLCLLNQPQ